MQAQKKSQQAQGAAATEQAVMCRAIKDGPREIVDISDGAH